MDSTLLGVKRGEARVTPYQAEWAVEFSKEAARVMSALGASAWIEHIGSTSVPGLSSKPIIDMLVGVPAGDFDATAAKLVGCGYEDRGAPYHPDDRIFIFVRDTIQTHKIHLATHLGAQWQQKLHFRDRLRASAELRTQYGELKTILAEKFGKDRKSYTKNKDNFIQAVLAEP